MQVAKKIKDLNLDERGREFRTALMMQENIYFSIFNRKALKQQPLNLDQLRRDYALFSQSRVRRARDELYCAKTAVAHLEKNERVDE